MNLFQFFESEALALPKSCASASFEDYVEAIFSCFLSAVNSLDDCSDVGQQISSSAPTLTTVCEQLRATLDYYLRGYPHRAYLQLEAALTTLNPWLEPVIFPISQLEVDSSFASTDPGRELRGPLFRIRRGSLAAFRRPDLFHIPFQERTLVTTQRYSIPGLPSLYLGGSLWICWEEIGRPEFQSLQISRFAADAHLRVLDFAWRPRHIAYSLARLCADHPNFVIGQAMYWPLLAICSISRKSPERPFAPEYIIPQMLLQWLRDEDRADGIRYFSTRAPHYEHDVNAGANYVFPVQSKHAHGHCPVLLEKFALTPPAAWSLLESVDIASAPGVLHQAWRISIAEGEFATYGTSTFAKLEQKLLGLPIDFAG